MIRYDASWVVPISEPPLKDGWVTVEGQQVVACGPRAQKDRVDPTSQEIDLGHVAVLPGLVNAHTHLELSYLRDRIPAGGGFVAWIRRLLAERRQLADSSAAEVVDAVHDAVAEATRSGTALVGDISNTLVTVAELRPTSLAALVFYELLGFKAANPVELVDRARERLARVEPNGRVRVSLAAHAPYSVAPSLFRQIRLRADQDLSQPYSVHLAESDEEVQFVRSGRGPWRELLEELGVWDPAWIAPGVSPVQYLADIGFLGPRTLAVHAVQATTADLATLAACDTTLVTCPRSNARTGAGVPPIEAFYRSGTRVAVGTDSLASTPDLNLFSELAEMHALAPSVPARLLLESATRHGALALGFDEYGTIEPGRCARLIAVDIPRGTDDVEEYLMSGVQPEQVRWIGE